MATTTTPPLHGSPRLIFGRFRFWLSMVALVVILAGLLFGFDQGVISGALSFMAKDLHLGTTLQEVVTSWVTLGALFGALAAGDLADRFGRQKALLAGGALFVAGGLLQSLAPDTAVVVIGRFVVGFGVGVGSLAGPLYAAEMAPASVRGRFVSTYQVALTFGILLAYITDFALSSSGRWRVMLGLTVVPGVLLLVVAWWMPDTPRWYLRHGRRAEARATLAKTIGGEDLDGRLDKMQAQLAKTMGVRWKDVFAPDLRRALWVATGLAVFQQVTGINAVIYYADKIFGFAGFTTPHQQTIATIVAVGVVNVMATLIAIAWIDKFGRKPLLYAGLTGMTVALVAIGVAFAFLTNHAVGGKPSVTGIITFLATVVYIASFAFSLGPVVWTMISEIFPNRIRGKAMGVATAVNWGAAFIVSATFLSIVNAIGKAAVFFIFAGLCVVTFFWVMAKVPETKGKTLEQIQTAFHEHDQHRQAAKVRAYATDA